ncbi:unnamed protein product [Lymnaea stagnalis]|uniref:Uncharacterized protein n=1 Tax=Lymnaea stagnalis TaxID=6523 RepID=A0AAV2HQ56_LYMST
METSDRMTLKKTHCQIRIQKMVLLQTIKRCLYRKGLYQPTSFRKPATATVRLVNRTLPESPTFGSNVTEQYMTIAVVLLYAGTFYWLFRQDAFMTFAPDVDEDCQCFEMEPPPPPCPCSNR